MQKSKHILRTNGNPRHTCFSVAVLFGVRAQRWTRSAVLLMLIALLNACAGTTPIEVDVPSEPVETSATAAALMERAARAPADRAAALYLQAAWAYLEDTAPQAPTEPPQAAAEDVLPSPAITGPDYLAAERAYALIEPGWLDPALLPDYHLLTAALAINRGTFSEAREAMALVPFELRRSARALRTSSALCEAAADFRCALRDRIAAAGDDPSDNEQIWSLLNRSLTLAASTRR